MLPAHTWAGLDEVAVKHCGERVLIVSGIGSTECGPVPLTTSWDPRREAIVGLPVAGVELKLAPVNDKLELRVRGDCVTPGYWNDPERSAAAFDDEGYFCLGDAASFVDPAHPERGLRFDGRIAENFKLSSGTWVHAGPLRSTALAAFSPLVQDVVIAGSGEDHVGALVFPDLAACRALDPALAGRCARGRGHRQPARPGGLPAAAGCAGRRRHRQLEPRAAHRRGDASRPRSTAAR